MRQGSPDAPAKATFGSAGERAEIGRLCRARHNRPISARYPASLSLRTSERILVRRLERRIGMEPSSGGVLNRFLNWLGGHELAVLLAFAGLISCVWLFGWIAAEMTDGDTQAFD